MSLRPRVMLIVLLVAVVLIWWLALGRPSAERTSSADQNATAALLPGPAEKPHRARSVSSAPPRESAAPTPPPPSPPHALAEQEGAPAIIAPDTRGFVDALEHNFESDDPDTTAGRDEVWLRELFRRAGGPADMLRSVVCRKTTCKLELRWTAERDAPYRRAMDQLGAANAKFVAVRTAEPDERGAVLVSAFVARAARAALENADR